MFCSVLPEHTYMACLRQRTGFTTACPIKSRTVQQHTPNGHDSCLYDQFVHVHVHAISRLILTEALPLVGAAVASPGTPPPRSP